MFIISRRLQLVTPSQIAHHTGKVSHNFNFYLNIHDVRKPTPGVWTFMSKSYWVNFCVKIFVQHNIARGIIVNWF